MREEWLLKNTRETEVRRDRSTYFEEVSPSPSPLASALPPTLPPCVVCGTTLGVPVVRTLSTPSVAVTCLDDCVSVN